MGFRVYNTEGEDVTDNGSEWVIDKNGTLYFITDDVDNPLIEAEDFWYSMN